LDKQSEIAQSDVPLVVVACNGTAENGAITAGDLLVTSGKEGYAMKGTDRTGWLVQSSGRLWVSRMLIVQDLLASFFILAG
jgi:hypothetical protein